MMEDSSMDQFIKLVMMLLIIGFVVIAGIILFDVVRHAYGQDVDPEWYCLSHQGPFCRAVDQQKILDIIEEFCDYDESRCVLGIPDPDFEK